jgi:hypothetical protein
MSKMKAQNLVIRLVEAIAEKYTNIQLTLPVGLNTKRVVY